MSDIYASLATRRFRNTVNTKLKELEERILHLESKLLASKDLKKQESSL